MSSVEEADSVSLAPNHHPGPSPSQSSGDGVPHVQSSVAGAVFNFVNSIIGAGIIGLPYALREAGLGAGVLLLFVIASLTLYSIQLIVALGVASRQYDYEALCEHAFGARGFYAIMLAMFLFAMGAMIAYLVILSDSAVLVFANWSNTVPSPYLRRVVLLLSSCSLLLPLCLVRNMASLSRASALSLAAVAWILFVVVYRACGGAPGAPLPLPPAQTSLPFIASDVFPGIGIISCAFVCHHNSFIVFNSLKERSLENWRLTARSSVLSSVATSLALALAGYLQFRGITRSNILNNYTTDDGLVTVTRLIYAGTMIMTYPMEIFVARHCVTIVCARLGLLTLRDHTPGTAFVPTPNSLSTVAHVSISLGLFLATLAVALLTDDLGVVLELTGSVSATVLGFIMPAALFFQLGGVRLRFWMHPDGRRAGFIAAWPGLALGFFGILAFGCSTILTLIKIGTGKQ